MCHFKEFCSVQTAQRVCSCDLSKDCVLYVPFQGASALTSIEDVFLGTCSCSYCLCAIPRGSCSVLLGCHTSVSSVCHFKKHTLCWTSTKAALCGAVTCNALVVCHFEGLMLCQTSTAGVSLVNCGGCQRRKVSGISAGASAAVSEHHKLAESHMFT